MNRTVRHGRSFQKTQGALCAGVARVLTRGVAPVLAASLATRLVAHRARAAPVARVQKRTRILWTLILAVLLPAASSLGQTAPGDPYLCYKAALAAGQPTFTPVQKTLRTSSARSSST